MKIIDFEPKGNVIRFYLGDDDCADYWGDDWDDTPYEHNAGIVYEKYCGGYADIFVDWELSVLTPDKDWHYQMNSPFCKEDFKNRKAPCVIISRSDSWLGECYSEKLGDDSTIKFYFEDKIEPGMYFINEKSLPQPKIKEHNLNFLKNNDIIYM